MIDLSIEMESLTKSLVCIKSVNGTTGERDIAEFLLHWLRTLPYFAAHPAQAFAQPIAAGDALGRENVFAYVRGTKAGGDAVFLVLLKYLSEHTDTFAGTVVLSLNCVEENEHTGILRGLDVLDDLRERLGLRYLFAINNDYTCPLYDGDPHRYLYAGAVGKLLPCVYIRGCETHVGQCFEGFDASVAVADVVQAVNYNTELCDGYHGEYTLPPSVLKMKHLRPSYNVQTAQEAWTYFNVFVHAKSAADVLEKFLDITRNAMQHVAKRIDNEATKYARLAQQPVLPPKFEPQVMSYEQLVAAVKAKRAAGRSDALSSAGQGSDASDDPATFCLPHRGRGTAKRWWVWRR